jgi:alanine racemase
MSILAEHRCPVEVVPVMTLTRRSFLAAGLGLPTLLDAVRGEHTPSDDPSPRTDPPSAPDSSLDPWVELVPAHLHHNVMEISRRVASRPILAVIKNNGYGMGIVQVARSLEPEPAIAGFAVVKLHEAITLRDAGIRKPVLLLGPLAETELADAVARDVMPMVYTPLGAALDRVAAQRQHRVPIHICIDTGLGRVGVPYRDAQPLIRDLASRQSVDLRGTMMTFTEDAKLDPEQIRRFLDVCTALERSGLALGAKHAASSFGLFQRPDAFFDMVRPGMAIYGIYPENEFRHTGVMDLKPALSLKARVIYVKRLRQGDTAGYNVAYTAPTDTWVATLPVGHADGWPREVAKGARVRVNGQLFPIIAAVSASHCIIDLGPNEPQVNPGDIGTLFDWEEGSRPEDVSEACGASVYDLTMHLNPLLPRRTV